MKTKTKTKTVRVKLKRREPCAECDACGKPIYYGNASVTINRHVEQIDQTIGYPDGEVTVIDSDTMITLCAGCGNKFSTERITEVLKAALAQPLHAQN